MNRYFSIVLLFSFWVCCAAVSAQHTNFRIHGKLAGLKKGVSICIIAAERPTDGSEIFADIASATVTKAGEFEISGTISHPQYVTLITNNLEMLGEKAEKNNYKQVHWTYTPMWLEADEYVIKAPKYSLLTDAPLTDKCIIEGGQAQADFNDLNHEKIAKGIADYNPDIEALAKIEWDFITSHPSSPVALYMACEKLTNGYNLSREQLELLDKTITSCPSDTARFTQFKRRLEAARLTANGNPIVDLDMTTTTDERCQLTEICKQYQGKYLLVDFWASWCGICRAGTPTIKEYYNKYPREQFDVISVSSDEKHDAWRAAMEKDQMSWAQYCLTSQGIKDLMSKYQIIGVPYYLILSPEGKVIANPGGVDNIGSLLEKIINP